jgi:hypothetical protein
MTLYVMGTSGSHLQTLPIRMCGDIRVSKSCIITISRYRETQQQPAAPITVFNAQLVQLQLYCILMSFRQLCYIQKMLCNCWEQLCAPWWCTSKDRNMQKLVFCDIIVILIKPSAIVGSNCNHWIRMHGTDSVLDCIVTISFSILYYGCLQ